MSSTLSLPNLSAIVSVRGPLLAFRKAGQLWVLRAGTDPRAWVLRLDCRGRGIGGWKHGRPDAESFLRRTTRLREARASLLQELREIVAENTHPLLPVATSQMYLRRDCLRRLCKIDQLARWTELFPSDAIEFLDRHDFRSRCWHLLNLWLRVPEGRELFDDVPALAWLAASSWCFKQRPVRRPLRSMRSLVSKPRRWLLRWLDLPEGDGVIRLLRTIRPADLNPLHAEAVCRVLRDEKRRRWWQNLPRPGDRRSLQLLAYATPLTFSLLCAVNEGCRVGGVGGMTVAQVLEDTKRMLHLLGRDVAETPLPRIESPERLLEMHDQLTEEFTDLRAISRDTAESRQLTRDVPPPLSPAHWMRPISNLAELLCEGAQMRHCVASFERRIAAGDYYVYAVHHPQGRATLALFRLDSGDWSIAELRGRRNAAVPLAVSADVAAWLNESTSTEDVFASRRERHGNPNIVPESQLWLDFDAGYEKENKTIRHSWSLADSVG